MAQLATLIKINAAGNEKPGKKAGLIANIFQEP
jgi:hypothetical protein